MPPTPLWLAPASAASSLFVDGTVYRSSPQGRASHRPDEGRQTVAEDRQGDRGKDTREGFHLLETAPPPDKFKCKDGNSEHEKGKKEGHPPPVYVVSGGTGASGQQIVETVLAQFPTLRVPIIVRNHVRSLQQVEIAVKEAEAEGGTVCIRSWTAP